MRLCIPPRAQRKALRDPRAESASDRWSLDAIGGGFLDQILFVGEIYTFTLIIYIVPIRYFNSG